MASRSWARSNSSSTSWIRLFSAATSPSACGKHNRPQLGLWTSHLLADKSSQLISFLKTAKASPCYVQGSSEKLSLSAFCLFKLWHLRNFKVWSMCFSFLFYWYLSFLPYSKGFDMDCRWRSVFRSLHRAGSTHRIPKLKTELFPQGLVPKTSQLISLFLVSSQIAAISCHSTLLKLKLFHYPLWAP